MNAVEQPLESTVEPHGTPPHPPSATRPADCEWGAFTDEAPWVLERSDIRWLPLAERLRSAARRGPRFLISPSRLGSLQVLES